MIAGVIVAGGAGVRAGGRKSLLAFAEGTLLEAVIACVGPQVGALALNVPALDADIFRARLGPEFPILHDTIVPAVGPLGGVLSGLEWAAATGNADWLASFPGDTPFLPGDLVSQLRMAAASETPVAAADANRAHALCAIWPLACAGALRDGIMTGRMRSMMSAIEGLNGQVVRVACEPDAFFNVNTLDDLAAAETIRTRRHTP